MSKHIRLKNYLQHLPDYVFDFIQKYYDGESINTQIAYAIDLKVYFTYLTEHFYKNINIENITIKQLESVSLTDLINYKDYLKEYQLTYISPITNKNITKTITNDTKGISRKLASLHSFYSYLFKTEQIQSNITEKLDLPKIKHHMKKPMSMLESLKFVDVVMNGEKYITDKRLLTEYNLRKLRDTALFITLLGVMCRVSEIVNLDIDDIDFENSSFTVKRKGGNFEEIFMPIQVENALYEYIQQRKLVDTKDKALFISKRKTRITVSMVEKLMKSYCDLAEITHPDKRTIHSLRRTGACQLLNDNVNIQMVSQLLGHSSVMVTSKYYAQYNNEQKREVMKNREIY